MSRLTVISAIASFVIMTAYLTKVFSFEDSVLAFLWFILVGVNRKEIEK